VHPITSSQWENVILSVVMKRQSGEAKVVLSSRVHGTIVSRHIA
jgi:hypothetical protein